jgi:hypothetical protein
MRATLACTHIAKDMSAIIIADNLIIAENNFHR